MRRTSFAPVGRRTSRNRVPAGNPDGIVRPASPHVSAESSRIRDSPIGRWKLESERSRQPSRFDRRWDRDVADDPVGNLDGVSPRQGWRIGTPSLRAFNMLIVRFGHVVPLSRSSVLLLVREIIASPSALLGAVAHCDAVSGA